MEKRERLLFLYLSCFLILSLGAFVWQTFMPLFAASFSTWNISIGWQREIGLWNIAVDLGILLTLIKRNVKYAEILTIMVTVLCIILGINHFMAVISAKNGNTILHWIGTIEVLLIGSGFGIYTIIKSRLIKNIF